MNVCFIHEKTAGIIFICQNNEINSPWFFKNHKRYYNYNKHISSLFTNLLDACRSFYLNKTITIYVGTYVNTCVFAKWHAFFLCWCSFKLRHKFWKPHSSTKLLFFVFELTKNLYFFFLRTFNYLFFSLKNKVHCLNAFKRVSIKSL